MLKLDDIPVLGVGIGFRPELHLEQSRFEDRIDWFELVADRYLRSVPEGLDRVMPMLMRKPLVPHSLEMSVGTDGPLDLGYCDQVAELVRTVGASFSSDHLCMTRAGGLEIGQLTPIPFTPASAARCARKAREAQEILGVPFLLENVTYGFALPGSMGEAEFIAQVVTDAGCGLLLDLTNVFINSQNHRYDPYAFLDALPLSRVIQVHLAGGERHGDRWVDSHSGPVDAHPEVWGLLEHVVRRSPLRAILIERDQSFPERFEEILMDIERAREIFERGRRLGPSSPLPARAETAPALPSVEGLESAARLPVDEPELQLALTRVLVEPAVRKRFMADPRTEGRALGLDEAQVGALVTAGLEQIRTFALEVAGKRLSLLAKVTPATYRLLEVEGRLHEIGHRFADELIPREAPEFPNRTVRDGFWMLGLLDRMIAEGETCRHLAEVVRFERAELTLLSTVALVESAKAFRRAFEASVSTGPQAALRPAEEEVLAARPRVGPHARVLRFACNVVELVRRLLEKASLDEIRAQPTLVLFSKAPGFRNVHHLAINERTRRLLELCDGTRTTAEIAALLSPRVAGEDARRHAAGCAEVVWRLAELNTVTLAEPS